MYEDDKIKIIEFKNKVRIINRNTCEIVTFDRDVFLKMCKEVAKNEQRNNGTDKRRTVSAEKQV